MKKHLKKIAATILAFLMLVSVLITAVPPEGFDWAMEAEAAEEFADSVVSANYNKMLERAKSYLNYKWAPSKDIKTWNNSSYNGSTTFKAGITVTGVPYTLFAVTDLNGFKNIKDSNYTHSGNCSRGYRTGPYYGSCCATYVSEIFGISPRIHSVSVLQNSGKVKVLYDQKADQIKIGDALSIPGHIIWVGDITDEYFDIYEQTYPVTKFTRVYMAKSKRSTQYFKFGGSIYSTIERIKISDSPGDSSPSTPTVPASGPESYVFDSGFYYSKYKSEFDKAGITTPEALYSHWLTFGIKEGRCASVVFDVRYYLDNNPDLKKAFGNDFQAAYNHFVSKGYNEYRKSSVIYDGTYYGERYSSELSGYGSEGRLKHFINNGKNEGRSASATFDFAYYKAVNPSLAAAYGNSDNWAYYNHYMYYDYPNGVLAYDTKKPTGSDLKIYDVTKDGYWVSCKIEDVSGVSKVQFPTWRSGESSDTAIWYTGTYDSSTGLAKVYVPISDFNNIEGRYHTDVYATDKKDNFGRCGGSSTYIDRTNPVVESWEITEISSKGYRITCTVSDNVEVSSVWFPTNPNSEPRDGAEWTWLKGTISGNTATCYVNTSDFGGITGEYYTHIHVYDTCGNVNRARVCASVEGDNSRPYFESLKISNISSEGYLITCKVNDDNGIESVSFPTNPIYEPSDGADWTWLSAKYAASTDTYYCYVKTSDFGGVTGETYHTHAYVYDTSKNYKGVALRIDVPSDKPSENIGDMFWATVRNVGTDKYLTDGEDSNSPSGHNAFLHSKIDESPSQMWLFYRKENGYYEIMNWDSALALTTKHESAICNDSVITQSTGSTISSAQEWSLTCSTDGYYAISPACGMSMALDVKNTDIILFDNYCGTNETFEITPISLIEELNALTDEVLLSVGGKFDIRSNIVITPEDAHIKTLRYVSEDESVAKVSTDGMITAVGTGTTRVLVYPTDGTVLEYIDENGIVHNETYVTVTVVEEIIPATGVVLSSDEKKIAVGETASVFATVLPENNTDNPMLIWSSSNENVAIVKNGLITAVDVGEAEITVTAGEFTSICNVTVVKPITSLELLCDDTVTINNSSAFSAPVVMYPPDTTDVVTWTSSDESVAVVDEYGNVTAVGAGECTITASVGGLSSDFGVEVPMVETTSLVINTEDAALKKGELLLVSKVVYPYNSTDEIVWVSSDESVATVVDGTVTAVGAGNCVITATSGNCSESFNLNVYIPVNSVTLDKTSLELKVGESYTFAPTVAPADTTDTLFWYTDEPEGEYPIAIIDENGKLTAKRAGVTTVVASIGEYYELCEVTVTEVDYDVDLNINGGASKLYEPWGLRYFAAFNGDDVDKIADRGIAILKDTYYTDDMTAEEFCAAENAHVYLDSEGELGFEAASTNNPNGRYYATLTEGIYSYDISAYYYVVPFAVMENGQTIYGTIKKNSMEKILNTNLNLTSITAEEKAICTCILDLKDSVAAHYAASGVPGASIDMEIPRGSSQAAAVSITTTTQSGITPNIVAGASRLIEPWGLRYFATYTDSDSIADRGVVILCEKYFDSSYKTAQDKMRLNANSYVFTESDGTLLYDKGSGRYYATVTEGISSKDIADVYYVVPYVVLENGSYVYGTVKSNSMMKIMNTNLSITSVSETEKEVSRDIIALYEAVQAYYAA